MIMQLDVVRCRGDISTSIFSCTSESSIYLSSILLFWLIYLGRIECQLGGVSEVEAYNNIAQCNLT